MIDIGYLAGDIRGEGRSGHHRYIWLACEQCRKERWVKKILHDAGRSKICISCANRLPRNNPKGEEHHNWKGGIIKNDGRIFLLRPNHPRAQKTGYISRARLVLEEKLGRFLYSWENTHHINGKKDDDRPDNLEAKSNSSHISGHVVGRERNKRGQFVALSDRVLR